MDSQTNRTSGKESKKFRYREWVGCRLSHPVRHLKNARKTARLRSPGIQLFLTPCSPKEAPNEPHIMLLVTSQRPCKGHSSHHQQKTRPSQESALKIALWVRFNSSVWQNKVYLKIFLNRARYRRIFGALRGNRGPFWARIGLGNGGRGYKG